MKLQKFVVPILLTTALFLVACGPTAPEPAAQTAVEATPTPAADTPTPAAEAAKPAEAPASTGEAAIYTIDPATSNVTWYGSKPIGASETGTVQIAEGQMSFTGDQLVAGAITIDMTTIATTSQSGSFAEQLVDHLSSDDFFGVATFPTATLVLKAAEPTGTANQYKVKADITIKTITKEIEFVTDVTMTESELNAGAEIIVNRADFDVRYNSGTFFSNLGDNLISDEMKITVTLVARKA